MATKLQTVSELTAQTMKRLTRSHEEWMSFLDTAAWLYKYPWHEQVMIYAQRPDATACASFDTWHLPRFRRWINSGAKGIALIDDSGERPALKYVYDVSDTNTRYNIPFKLWELREEHEAQVMDELTDHFGDITEYAGLPFPDKLMGIIHIAVEDNAEDYLNALYKVTDGSYLDDLDKLNIEVSFKRALEASIGYMALTRLGFDAREYYEHEDFIPVFDFNTSQTLSQLGAATGDIAVMVLRQIERSVRGIEKQERDTLADSIMLIENELTKKMKGALAMNEITYSRNGDYMIPDIAMDEQPMERIGKYGMMRKRFLKENRKGTYSHLLMSGKLTEHLLEIDGTAREQVGQIMAQMAKTEGLTEELKASDQMAWVGLMNSIKHRAEETVLTELIYS